MFDAEQHVEHERPVIADRHGDQSHRPEKLCYRRYVRFDYFKNLVYLMRKGRMGDADAQFRTWKSRCDRTNLDFGKDFSKDVVMGLLDIQDFRDSFE